MTTTTPTPNLPPGPLPQPPTAAVAADAHWAAKLARLRARALPERALRLCDDDQAKRGVTDAALGLAKARTAASREASDQKVPDGQREDWITSHPEVAAAQARLDEAQAVLKAATLVLWFRALPRPALEQLLRDHPPTEGQADEGMEYNVETYPAALIAACHIEYGPDRQVLPGMTEADAQVLLDAWPDAEAKALFGTAVMVNQTMRGDLGKG